MIREQHARMVASLMPESSLLVSLAGLASVVGLFGRSCIRIPMIGGVTDVRWPFF